MTLFEFPNSQDTDHAPVQSAFQTAVQLLAAGRASLLLREGDGMVLTVAASVGIRQALVPDIRVTVGEGIAGMVAQQDMSLFGELENGTFLSTPVSSEGGVEGVLNVTNRRGGRQYTVDDMPLAESVARHIGHLIVYSRLAARDSLSGLSNRRAFTEALERELALSARKKSVFSVVFLDLDNLKTLNDEFGHAKGDEAIRGIGETLQHVLRPYDFAARFGGDEFALLLSGSDEPDEIVGDRIANALEQLSEQLGLPIAVSMGVARYPADGQVGANLVAVADERMYHQKREKKLRALA